MLNIICIIPSSGKNNTLAILKRNLERLKLAARNRAKLKILIVSANEKLREKIIDYQIDNFYLIDSGLGFAQMNNTAIEESLRFYDSDFYLFINDDAWVQKNFFHTFQKKIAQSDLEIINPLVYEAGKKVIDSFGVEYFTSGYAKNANSFNYPTTLSTAACLFVKTSCLKKMLRKYGFIFNPILHFYLEDVEFSIRAKAIGMKIGKFSDLVAYHYGSTSSGKKSRFVMYQTYRNIIWVILMTWPRKILREQMFSVLLIQIWVSSYSFFRFGPGFYLRIWIETFINLAQILRLRKAIQTKYLSAFKYDSLFANYSFRTYGGLTVKASLFSFLGFFLQYLKSKTNYDKQTTYSFQSNS